MQVIETLVITQEERVTLKKIQEFMDNIYEETDSRGDLESIAYNLRCGIDALLNYEYLKVE